MVRYPLSLLLHIGTCPLTWWSNDRGPLNAKPLSTMQITPYCWSAATCVRCVSHATGKDFKAGQQGDNIQPTKGQQPGQYNCPSGPYLIPYLLEHAILYITYQMRYVEYVMLCHTYSIVTSKHNLSIFEKADFEYGLLCLLNMGIFANCVFSLVNAEILPPKCVYRRETIWTVW